MVKQTWGMLTGNDLQEIEGKRDKLLGRLQKKYGSIKDKAELEYQDSIELAEIVSRIREIMNIKNHSTAIAFIARYGKPLLAKNQERQITEKKNQVGTIPIAILILASVGVIPTRPYSKSRGIWSITS